MLRHGAPQRVLSKDGLLLVASPMTGDPVQLVLGWAEPRLARLRPLLPFAIVAMVGSLVFAWMCDAVGDHNGVTALDQPVSLWFATHRSVAEGHLGLLLAKATSPAVLIVVVAVTAFLLRRRGFRLESTLIAGATVVAYLAGAVVKFAEHRGRPVSPVNLAPESEFSFPSGHVLVVAVVVVVAVGLAWTHLTRAARILAAVASTGAILLIALDRLVVGAHWLTDVVGSVALAGIIAAVVLSFHKLVSDRD